MFVEIFMTASLAINVLVLVPCLSFSWKDAALKRPWHIYEKRGQRQRHYGSPAIETCELSISPGNINFLVAWGKALQRVIMCHAVPDSLGACLQWSLLRWRGHEGSVWTRDTGKRNLEGSLHVSWQPGRVDILGVGTTYL